MSLPIIDLNSPTQVALHWGWLLITSANAVVFVLLVVVFVIGVTVREPGVGRDLARARQEHEAAASGQDRR